MLSKTLSTAAVALAASTMVSAQTSTLCNPMKKDCPADPAFGKNGGECDFTKGECKVFKALEGTDGDFNDKGMTLSISKATEAPTYRSDNYIFFGRVDVDVIAAKGNGIVTSAVLLSDDLDEVDFEWVGGDNKQVQSNYFSKGDDSTFDRGAYHDVSNPLDEVHTYSFEWTREAVKWMIDGNVVRTLTAKGAQGGVSGFPQTPMQVKLGSWCAGGPDSPDGTAEWAGGRTDFSKGPFNAYYKSVKITDYAGGDGATTKSVKEYTYGDKTGSMDSIKIVNGDGSSDDGDDNKSTEQSKTQAKTDSKTKSATPSTKSAVATTSAKETETTMSSVVSTDAGKQTESASATGDKTSPAATSSAAPTSTDTPGAASRGTVAVGSALLAGAGLFVAQLFL